MMQKAVLLNNYVKLYKEIETLIKAEEVFITNSLMEIMPVSRIEDYKIGKTIPGKVTQQIMSAYKSLI